MAVDVAQLANEVEQLRALLNEREQDLILAAEYGQTLLDQNKALREQLAAAQAAQAQHSDKVIRGADFEHHRQRVRELEDQVDALRTQLKEYQELDDDEERSLQRRLRQAEEAAATAQQALAALRLTASQDVERMAALEASHERLTEELRMAKVGSTLKKSVEKAGLSHGCRFGLSPVAIWQHEMAEQAKLVEVQSENLDALRAERQQWTLDRAALERRCQRLEEESQRAQHDAGACRKEKSLLTACRCSTEPACIPLRRVLFRAV